MERIIFERLAYGKVLFDEAFWNTIIFLLGKNSHKEVERILIELLPYVNELKRIYDEGSEEELAMLTEFLVNFFQKSDETKKIAWFNFCKLFLPEFLANLPIK